MPDNTLYPHINNNIEYGLFEDVINSYNLDRQIKDDLNCNKECCTNTQHTQQEQQLTPCTLNYHHITQHINNLANSTQQNTLYAMEENASLFNSDTTTPCNFNITEYTLDLENANQIPKYYQEFIHKANINIEMLLAIPICSITTLIMVMHSILKMNTPHYYNKNCKILTGVHRIPL